MKTLLSFRALVLSALLVMVAITERSLAEEGSVVIDKAIKAVGGESKLAKLKSVSLKTKTQLRFGNKEANFFGDCSAFESDKLLSIGEADGVATRLVLAPLGCWAKFGEQVEEARSDALPAVRKMLFALRASQILLPLKDKEVTLSPGWDGEVGDRPALLVKATHKDHGDLLFYFDKQTGLLAKVESRTKLSIDQLERVIEFRFSEYKDFDGLKCFTKINVSGDLEFGEKLNSEITLSDIKAETKLEDNLFSKP